MGWISIAILVLLASAAALMIALRQVKDAHERDQALVERVRTSALYSRLYPLLERCNDCCIEQVLIRAEEIRITLYKPTNRTVRFVMEEHGLDPVDQPETLRALASAISLDVECLGDPKRFYFVPRAVKDDVGATVCWYEYNVQPDFKDQMLRAWYDQKEPEEGVFR